MFGDRDHDRRVAEGAAGAAVAGGVVAAFIWLGLVKGYCAVFRRFPKTTFSLTVLVILALIFVKQVSYGINWFTVHEHLPDGNYVVERYLKDQLISKHSLVAKDGKISRDGKEFEEVRWERDLKFGTFVMSGLNAKPVELSDPSSQSQAFMERKDEEGRTYFRVFLGYHYRMSEEPDSPMYSRARFSQDRREIYRWTPTEEIAAQSGDEQRKGGEKQVAQGQ